VSTSLRSGSARYGTVDGTWLAFVKQPRYREERVIAGQILVPWLSRVLGSVGFVVASIVVRVTVVFNIFNRGRRVVNGLWPLRIGGRMMVFTGWLSVESDFTDWLIGGFLIG
jgi:hypothetical protein